jgi:hypothetical protein
LSSLSSRSNRNNGGTNLLLPLSNPRINLCMSHHCGLHLERFPFSCRALASVEYAGRSRKVALHGCLAPHLYGCTRQRGRATTGGSGWQAQGSCPSPGAAAQQGQSHHGDAAPTRRRVSACSAAIAFARARSSALGGRRRNRSRIRSQETGSFSPTGVV